jgi:hypothetical protein
MAVGSGTKLGKDRDEAAHHEVDVGTDRRADDGTAEPITTPVAVAPMTMAAFCPFIACCGILVTTPSAMR